MLVKGSIVALVTPFHEDGSINFEKLEELVEFHIVNSTDALLILGTTGETPTMSHEEDDSIVKFVIEKAAHRIPIYVGAGSNCTATMKEYALKYEAMGAEALLVISPYYNKANEEGMYQHFKTVADAVHTPLIIYNVPGRTGCAISYNVIKRLSTHPNVAAIKEASGNISYMAQVARLCNDDFQMYSGNDDMIIPCLSLGGSGVISVLANVVPKDTHDMVMSYLQGDTKKGLDLQLKYLDFINALFCEANPIPVKAAMQILGMDSGTLRLPLYEISDGGRARLVKAMEGCGLL